MNEDEMKNLRKCLAMVAAGESNDAIARHFDFRTAQSVSVFLAGLRKMGFAIQTRPGRQKGYTLSPEQKKAASDRMKAMWGEVRAFRAAQNKHRSAA